MVRLQATSVGQAVAGFGVSVLSFGTIWAAPARHRGEVRTPADVATAACAYFGLSAAVVAASAAGYWVLQHLPFWHHHCASARGAGTPLLSCFFHICLLPWLSVGRNPLSLQNLLRYTGTSTQLYSPNRTWPCRLQHLTAPLDSTS